MATEGAKHIINAEDFNPAKDVSYTKPKLNASGGKSIGVLNSKTNKTLFLGTPLMLTWGANEYTDDKTDRKSYDLALQFPKDEYDTETLKKALKNMKAFEKKVKEDAAKNSKEWLNKTKASSEVIDALFTPMLKHPKDIESGEPDESRAPTLKVKLPYWEGEFKFELYDLECNQIFPSTDGHVISPLELLPKASNIATIIQCGGIWFANGKFGVTWKLVQAMVKPKESFRGKCHISLSSADKEKLMNSETPEEDVEEPAVLAEDSEDEDSAPAPTPVVAAPEPVADPDKESKPKKKVVKKKSTA